jgi:hypothetical protein
MKQAQERTQMPLRALVGRPLPDLDAVQMELAMTPGTTRLNVRHPYIGPSSWIRVMPEAGTLALTMQRGDDIREEIFGYIAPKPNIRIRQYKEGLVLYRPLDSGELELMSSGRAYAFFGGNGDVELRGGSIRQDLSQSNLEVRSIAPTFNRRLHKAATGAIGYEERFGVVKRPDTTSPNLLQKYVRQPDNTFSLEYSRWLSDTAGNPLVETQEGHVVDGGGQLVKQASTNKTLRSHRSWFHKQTGNLLFQITLTAQDIKATFTKTGTMTYGNSYTLRTKTVNEGATTSWTVKTPKARINTPDMGFGVAPVMPIALAQPTVQALSSVTGPMIGVMEAMVTAFTSTIPPLAVAAKTASTALAQAAASTAKIPSTQVKVTG